MPDWVTSYKLYGDFRGRFDEQTTSNPGNPATGLNAENQIRLRYRLRVGLLVNMKDDMQVGFRLGSDNSSGNELSNNTTLEGNGTKKPVWIDTAYRQMDADQRRHLDAGGNHWEDGSTVPGHADGVRPGLHAGRRRAAGDLQNQRQPVDRTQHGGFCAGQCVFNCQWRQRAGSTRDPYLIGGQLLWNANWTSKLASSMGFAAYNIVNKNGLGLSGFPANSANYNPGGVANNNQGNTRNATTGNLQYYYNPIVGSASVTYTLDSFPLYKGEFPIKLAGEFMYNPGGAQQQRRLVGRRHARQIRQERHVGHFLSLSIPGSGCLV